MDEVERDPVGVARTEPAAPEPEPEPMALDLEPAPVALEPAPVALEPEPVALEPEPVALEPETAPEVATAPVAPEPEPEPEPEPQTTLEPETPRTIGRLVADTLRSAGVRYAFTVPGESFLGILDVLEEAGIRVVATRHEGGAAFMAEAYGQLTGRPALCLATRAVGASNLAIGIHTARQDSTPLFALVGDVARAHAGREAFQAADLVGTIGGLAKWSAAPRTTVDVAPILSEAVRQALGGRAGPVLLALAEDLLDEPAPPGATVQTGRPPTKRAIDDEIRAVLHLLAGAERPVILAGAGVLRARTSSDLTRFAELLRVPVIASWRRGDVMSNDHDLYLGMAGLGASPVVRERLEHADAMLVIGCRLGEPTTYGYRIPADGTRWIHVDLEPAGSDASPRPERAISADARAFLRAANDRLVHHGVLEVARVDARVALNAADRAAFEAATVVDDTAWDGPGIHPGRTVTTLRHVLPDEAIITTDARGPSWARRPGRWATASPPRSLPPSSTATDPSSPWSATVDWR